MQSNKNNNNYILLLDPAGVISYACENSLRRFQMPAEQLCGRSFEQLKHPDMPAGPLKDLEEVVAQGRPWMGVIQLQDPQGEFWVNAYVVPVTDQGKVLELHCILTEAPADMTERARNTYRLRKAGKMPTRLRYPAVPLAVRASIAAVLAFVPLIAVAANQLALPVFLAVLAVSLVLVYILQAGLFSPFNRLVRSTHAIVHHPIKQLIYTDTHDDVGQLQLTLDMQQAQMSALLQRMQNTSTHIRDHAGQTMTGMQRIVADVGQQQSILEQLNQSAVSLSNSAHEINVQAQHNLEQSTSASTQIGAGQEILHHSIDAIHQLAASINESMSHFSRLQEKSGQINDIMTVIQAVAEQTNLLALNAAIEAARAGEMGRGFAVVADEVRNLAAQTQSSAQDIQVMIDELQQAIQAISGCLHAEQELSASSVEQIGQAGTAFEEMLGFIEQLHANMATLEDFSQQQDVIAEQVNQGVQGLQELTAQASDNASEALGYNQAMATMSERQTLMLTGLSQA